MIWINEQGSDLGLWAGYFLWLLQVWPSATLIKIEHDNMTKRTFWQFNPPPTNCIYLTPEILGLGLSPLVRTGQPDQFSWKRIPLLITTIQPIQWLAVVGLSKDFKKKLTFYFQIWPLRLASSEFRKTPFVTVLNRANTAGRTLSKFSMGYLEVLQGPPTWQNKKEKWKHIFIPCMFSFSSS